jgi:hypothetical protein
MHHKKHSNLGNDHRQEFRVVADDRDQEITHAFADGIMQNEAVDIRSLFPFLKADRW